MAAKDARIQPIYNCKHREYIELVDSDGAAIALNTGDTELSKDGAAFTDSAVEMAEISTGFCSLDFPYSEMAYNCVVVVPKSVGALTRVIKLFPRRWPVLRSGTAQAGAAATMTLDASASDKDGAYIGCWLRCSNNTPAGVQGDVSIITGYVGETKVATVADAWTDTPTSETTFEILVPSDMSISTLLADSGDIVDEWETQSQADPTGFHVNVKEVNGTAQTANDNGADINAILLDTGTNGVPLTAAAVDSILDEVVEGAYTLRQLIRGMVSILLGKVEDDGLSFRDLGDTKDRVTTVVDANDNRTNTIVDLT
jgi:hypothetical protein